MALVIPYGKDQNLWQPSQGFDRHCFLWMTLKNRQADFLKIFTCARQTRHFSKSSEEKLFLNQFLIDKAYSGPDQIRKMDPCGS
jgi:hypothetical protein